MPSWDVSCGLYAALAILAALRHRDATGAGSRIRLPLDDVALATAANLGFLTEAMVNGEQRPRLGNAIYGQYGRDFATSDGESFMVVALTARHFRDLIELTDTTKAVAALAETLGADFTDEGQRYEHREALDALFADWFGSHTAAEVSAALSAGSVLWDRYQSFMDVANSPRVTANPLFAAAAGPDREISGPRAAHVHRRPAHPCRPGTGARRRQPRGSGRMARPGRSRESGSVAMTHGVLAGCSR